MNVLNYITVHPWIAAIILIVLSWFVWRFISTLFNWLFAVLFGFCAVALSWYIPVVCLKIIAFYIGFNFADPPGSLVNLIEVVIAVFIFVTIIRKTYRWFIVIVPEFTALGVFDLITGKIEVYWAGAHIKKIWEQVKKSNFVSLKKITVAFVARYVAKDGSVIIIKGFIQYVCKQTKEAVKAYIGTEDEQIVVNILGRVKNYLIKDISAENYKEVREKIMELGKDLSALYEERDGQQSQMQDISNECGITVQRIVASDIEFDENTQGAITDRFAMEVLDGVPEPSDRKLIMLGKKIEKHVYGLDFGENSEVAKEFARGLSGALRTPVGTFAAGELAARMGGSPQSEQKTKTRKEDKK